MLDEKKHQTDDGGTPPPAPRTDVQINVKPLFRQRNTIVCDIDPPPGNSQGGNMHLPQGSYLLKFNLLEGKMPDLQFKADQHGVCQAFWSDADDCPNNEMNNDQYSPTRKDGKTIWVNVDTDGNQNAIHYRLNFDNNCKFDPIIIHD
jgi:hypothetical protein